MEMMHAAWDSRETLCTLKFFAKCMISSQEGPGAVLTSVGTSLKGLVRRGDTFFVPRLHDAGSGRGFSD